VRMPTGEAEGDTLTEFNAASSFLAVELPSSSVCFNSTVSTAGAAGAAATTPSSTTSMRLLLELVGAGEVGGCGSVLLCRFCRLRAGERRDDVADAAAGAVAAGDTLPPSYSAAAGEEEDAGWAGEAAAADALGAGDEVTSLLARAGELAADAGGEECSSSVRCLRLLPRLLPRGGGGGGGCTSAATAAAGSMCTPSGASACGSASLHAK
jgi:hypothetical protein